MKENPGSRRRHKARKTPTSPYPSVLPNIPPSVETMYHSINPNLLESAIAAFKDQIVTSQVLYKPGLLAAARVTFQGTRWEIHNERDILQVIPFPTHPQLGDWDKNLVTKWDNMNTRTSSEGVSFYVYDNTYDFSTERMEALQEEFIQHLISHEIMELSYNPYLKVYRKQDESEEAFFDHCLEKMRENFQMEMNTLEETIQWQQERLRERLDREVRELGQDPAGLESQGTVLSEIVTSKAAKRSVAETQEEIETRESMVTIEDIRKQLAELQVLKEVKMKQFEENLNTLARQQEKDILRLNRTNIEVLRFSVVWLPYTEFVIQEADQRRLLLIQSF